MSSNSYDPAMSLLLAQAVEQAYQYYLQNYVEGNGYQIQLPGYTVQSIFTVSEFGDDVPIGFTATGNQPGAPNLVIFRGTQTDEEAIEDMCWDSASCVLTDQDCGTAGSGVYSFYADDDDGAVDSLEYNVQQSVTAMLGVTTSSAWYFAGHSLGGALATLACLDAVVGNWITGQQNVSVQLYTYGSLHVGQQDFADIFNANINPGGVTNAFRVVNLADWVPSFLGGFIDLPDCDSGEAGQDATGYVHVGELCSYLWQTDGDWNNHALANTYLNTLQNYQSVVKVGPRNYPQ